MDATAKSILLDALRREGRSLLLYLGDAIPWTTLHAEANLQLLQRIIRTESEGIQALGVWLGRQRITPPPLESYPTSFTSYHFASLDFLLPRLLEAQKTAIAQLQKDVAALQGSEREHLSQFLRIKQMNLSALEALLTPQPSGT
jgi:hypothetical protein